MSESTPEVPQPAPTPEPPPNEPAVTKSFSQDDVNALLAKQKREQFGDYGDLRAKAARLEEIEQAQMTEQQRHAEAAAKAARDAEEARAETLRYKAAATHGVAADYFDLLGSGTEEEVNARAERVGTLVRVQAENEQLKAELEALRTGKPAPIARPVEALQPGATPSNTQSEDDVLYASLYGPNG